MPDSVISASRCGISCRKRCRRLLGAVAHDPLDAGAVVPAAVEDHDLAGGGQLLDVALHVELGLLPVGRRRQRDDAEDARADPLGQALDHAALAGGVAALEDDDDAGAGRLHPGLQVGDLDLQPGELRLVGLVAGLLRVGWGDVGSAPRRPSPSCASCSRASSGWACCLEGAERVVEVVEDHRPGRSAARTPARSSRPRDVGVQLGEAEGDAAARRGRRGPPRASRRRCSRPGRWRWRRARASGCRPAGVGDGAEPAPATWSALKKSRSPSIERDGEPGHRPGLGAAVQLVEAVAAGDAAEHARRAGTSSCAAGRRGWRRWR